MIAASVAAGVLFLLVYMALVVGLRAFCRWAVVREEARHHAVTFAESLPSAADVAATEAELPTLHDIRDEAMRVVLCEEMCVDLESAIAHIEGGWAS